MRLLEKLRSLFARNDDETRLIISKREQELDDERRLTRMSKMEAMDKLFAAMMESGETRR